MTYPTHLSKILGRITAQQSLAGVVRHPIQLDDTNDALTMVEMIGKAKDPKFVIDNQNRWVYTQLIKWLYGDPTVQALDADAAQNKRLQIVPGRLDSGIYIAGGTGTGKSWAMEILKVLTEVDRPMVSLGGQKKRLWPQIFRAEDIWEEASTSDAGMAKFKNMPILCIQDLGSEPAADAVHMGSRREPLRQILEARGDRNDLITLITSNFGIASPEIERRYTDRVVSRLRQMCNFLVLNGPDRRRKPFNS